ncbi:unnamed protein product, partial [Mycena citricolor]
MYLIMPQRLVPELTANELSTALHLEVPPPTCLYRADYRRSTAGDSPPRAPGSAGPLGCARERAVGGLVAKKACPIHDFQVRENPRASAFMGTVRHSDGGLIQLTAAASLDMGEARSREEWELPSHSTRKRSLSASTS